jgi:hypothetical protein
MKNKKIGRFIVVLLMIVSLAGSTGCSSPITKREQGGLIGAGVGAGSGAIIGSTVGHAAAGMNNSGRSTTAKLNWNGSGVRTSS